MSQLREHWQNVYQTKGESDLSWHQEDPGTSLELILQFANKESGVIDIGGGTSILAGRLCDRGFAHIAVVDISEVAVGRAKKRTGSSRHDIEWIVDDITQIKDLGCFGVWHDRAVFHFLTNAADRQKYITLATKTVPIGGHVIIGTFALDGPEKCSGLPVERYDAAKLARELGREFVLKKELREIHLTPWNSTQAFIYAVFEHFGGTMSE